MLLEIRNIETYYHFVCALQGVSLSVEQGTITTILGRNGAGKTTLLKTVMGLIEGQPRNGAIEFQGKRIDGMDTEDIVRMGISYVPQGRGIFEELTTRENLQMGAYSRKDWIRVKLDLERIYDLFPVLKGRENQCAGKLAGGEQQMLSIGRALMSSPRLLLLDEPSLGLSPLLSKEIFRIIQVVNGEDVTVFLAEQNVPMALAVSRFGMIMKNGRLAIKGTSSELLKDKEVLDFYKGIRDEASDGN